MSTVSLSTVRTPHVCSLNYYLHMARSRGLFSPMLKTALGQLANNKRFFVYRIKWSAEDGKYEKWPCDRQYGLPVNAANAAFHSFDDASRLVVEWGTADHALGYWFDVGCGYWFLDLDGAITNGVADARAQEIYARLPGVFFEHSSSGTGLHFVGRDVLAPHSSHPTGLGMELYSGGRGICFGLNGQAWGCADASGSPAIHDIAAKYFPPRTQGVSGSFDAPRSDWAGPTDDEELIALAVKSKSNRARFGHAESFASLWKGDGEKDNARDMALAQHLAFWTGCDAPRIERLMRQSGLYREKWDSHKTYLRELTIEGACAQQKEVLHRKEAEGMYVAPPPLPALPVAVVALDEAGQREALTLVAGCRSDIDMHQRVIPAIKALRLQPALMPRVLTEIEATLKLLRASLPRASLRALVGGEIAPVNGDDDEGFTRPAWLDDWVYLTNRHEMFHKPTGTSYGPSQFHAMLAREAAVPVNRQGNKEDVFRLATEQWECAMAFDSQYHAGMPEQFEFDGRLLQNEYTPRSVPGVAMGYSEIGVAAIKALHAHLGRMCNGRQDVLQWLLAFLAHQVQRPGVKIHWAPLIVGFEGSGKGVIGAVMRAAMGDRNVGVVGPAVLNNTGGFTDWGKGRALTILEEIYMTGDRRYQTINIIKTFVSEGGKIDINPKGGKPISILNGTNYCAFTNHHDAAPITDTDRRWLIIFTPFRNLLQMLAGTGCTTDEEYFDPIWRAVHECPGELRKWFMELQLPAMPRRAPETAEKLQMAANGMNEDDHDVAELIKIGGYGVSEIVFSSSCLAALSLIKNKKLPNGKERHHVYLRLGFVNLGVVKWQNKAHRLWATPDVAANGLEQVKQLLDSTVTAPNLTM